MSILPREIIREILLRLPVKTLVRFQCVSKSWQALINHSVFIKNHLELSIAANRDRTLIVEECVGDDEPDGDDESDGDDECGGDDESDGDDECGGDDECDGDPPLNFFCVRFNDDDRFDGALLKIRLPLHDPENYTQILDYCNGLVLFHNYFHNYYDRGIVIWNPLIRRYKKLPFEPIENPSGFTDWYRPRLAFGHDPGNDDYKVMRVVQFSRKFDSIKAFEVKVYSLRRHSWKRVEEEWPKEYSPISTSASLNGVFHWLVNRPPVTPETSDTLLAFDLATEKFQKYTIPVLTTYIDSTHVLEVLKGCICVCVNVGVTLNDVWVMKEYGVVSSWTRLYTIVQGAVPWTFEYCKPLVYSKDGKKVLMEQDCAYLFWYDIEERRGTRVRIRRMPKSFQAGICVGSLVLLDGDSVNNNPMEGLDLLVEAMEEVINEEQAV